MKIRRGDLVQILIGDDSGKEPRKVLQVLPAKGQVLVEGVNRVYKHVKRGHPKSPQGGRLSREMPIDISNVALYCSACDRGVRVGFQYTDDGSKIRVCKRCNTSLGTVSPSNPKYAAKSA